MATIWKETQHGFEARPLPAGAGGTEIGLRVLFADALPDLRVMPFRDRNRQGHALVAGENVVVRVNGAAMVSGLRVLDHKDEIAIGRQRVYFSAESAPIVETYQHDGSRRRPRCPICRAELQDGHSIVRCPGCSRIYHQIAAAGEAPEKPCWTYSPECRFCGHPTSLSGEPTWRPDDEEHPLNGRTQ